MKRVLFFLLSLWVLSEPIDEDFIEDEGQLIPGYAAVDEPEVGVADWDQTLREIENDAFERETGAHMKELHEPDNPDAQDRKIFYLPHASGPGLASIRSGPKPLDLNPVPVMPSPIVHEVVPEPVPMVPEPSEVQSRYQPVIIHHGDLSNPATRVSIHNLPSHLEPYQYRPDLPDLAPKDPEPAKIDVNPVTKALPNEGCKDSSSMMQQQGARVVEVTEDGHEIIEPMLLPIPQPVDCNKPNPTPPPPEPSRIVRNEPLLLKPCGMVPQGKPCYTTAIPTQMPTTTTTTRRPTFNPTTTAKPTNIPITTKKPTLPPTTTTKTIVIQPVIIVPDVAVTSAPDMPKGCKGNECPDKFINGVEPGVVVVKQIPAPKPAPKPKAQPPAPKPAPKHELHVHHFHISSDGKTIQHAETRSLIADGRNPEDDPLEEEGKKFEGLVLPPCKLNDPNFDREKDAIDCDMSSALARGATPPKRNEADAINAVLNDNLDDDVAIASLEDSLKKENKKENEHLQELIQSKATLDGTSTEGKAEKAGLALEKREVQREIASQKRRIEKSQQAEEQLAEKKKEEEAQVALKDKATQNALKKAEEKILEQQTEPGSIWTKVAETETAVNSNNDVRVASAAAQHPERITYLMLASLLLLFTIALHCVRKKPSNGYMPLLDASVDEV